MSEEKLTSNQEIISGRGLIWWEKSGKKTRQKEEKCSTSEGNGKEESEENDKNIP